MLWECSCLRGGYKLQNTHLDMKFLFLLFRAIASLQQQTGFIVASVVTSFRSTSFNIISSCCLLKKFVFSDAEMLKQR